MESMRHANDLSDNFQFVRIFITTYSLVWNLGFE